jgi:SAM-dependent methyltransferase
VIAASAEVEPRPIQPLALGVPGRYEDDRVVVDRATTGDQAPRRDHRLGWVRTPHFQVGRLGQRIHVVHRMPTSAIDDDLTGLLAAELFDPGWVSGADAFERIFTGVVMSTLDNPLDGWELFYRNTLERLGQPPPGRSAGHGSIDGYRPVYQRAISLVPPGEALELGCCFGFLSLQLAARGDVQVVASDVSAGTMGLLDAVQPRLNTAVRTLVADAARVPLPDRCVDTVLAVHLLEHLDHGEGAFVVAEALRLARKRVVIAVPFEAERSVEMGHVRVFDLESLAVLAGDVPRRWHAEVSAHHGGWLVIDRT